MIGSFYVERLRCGYNCNASHEVNIGSAIGKYERIARSRTRNKVDSASITSSGGGEASNSDCGELNDRTGDVALKTVK
jgi:hypothetical protein